MKFFGRKKEWVCTDEEVVTLQKKAGQKTKTGMEVVYSKSNPCMS